MDDLILVAVVVGLVIMAIRSGAFAATGPLGPYQGFELLPRGRYALVWSSMLDVDILQSMIFAAASAAGVPPEQLAAVVYIESRGNPVAHNDSDPSYGLCALLVPTAKMFADPGDVVTADSLMSDPELNLKCGARFIAGLSERYRAFFPFEEWIQAYNVGEHGFDTGRRNPEYAAGAVDTMTGQQVRLNPGQLAAVLCGEL